MPSDDACHTVVSSEMGTSQSVKQFCPFSQIVSFFTHGSRWLLQMCFTGAFTVFYSAHCTDFSEIIENLKNHKSPGLDEMRAEILKVSLMQ